MDVYVGIDWGCGSHAVCVIDTKGGVLDRFDAGHDREGLAGLVARLERRGSLGRVPIAIERPTGLLVDHLVEAGFMAVPIHPNAVARVPGGVGQERSRRRLHLGRCAAHRWSSASPASAPVRRHPCLTGAGRGAAMAWSPLGWHLAPQLAAPLEGFWPCGVAIFADVASPIALAFLDRYPTPDSARRLGRARLASFLARHRYSGHRSPETLLKRRRAAPLGQAGEAERLAKGEMVRALARTLSALVDQLGQLTRRIEDTVACDHPHAVRILARAWVRALWRAWTDRQPYDPERHAPAKSRTGPNLATG